MVVVGAAVVVVVVDVAGTSGVLFPSPSAFSGLFIRVLIFETSCVELTILEELPFSSPNGNTEVSRSRSLIS